MSDLPYSSAGRLYANDVHEYPEIMSEWDIELIQLSPGTFRAIIEYLQVGPFLLYREHWTKRVIASATSPANAFSIACSRSGAANIVWNGEEIHYGNVAVARPGSEIIATSPDDNEHLVLEVAEDRYREIISPGDSQLPSETNNHLKISVDKGARFFKSLDALLGKYLSQAELLADKRIGRAIELQIQDQFTKILLSEDQVPQDSRQATRGKLLSHALEVSQEIRCPLTLHELASKAGATPRTLQRTFQTALGISPLKYLRWSRLNGLHKDLSDSNADETSVTETATQWGFTELGRMAGEYRQLFGELPEHTLARRQGPKPRDLYEFLSK